MPKTYQMSNLNQMQMNASNLGETNTGKPSLPENTIPEEDTLTLQKNPDTLWQHFNIDVVNMRDVLRTFPMRPNEKKNSKGS